VSILTKIFVVLVTVLAIGMVPLMVAYVENTQHYRQELQKVDDARIVAESRANFLERRNQEIQGKFSEAIAEKVEAQARLEERLIARLGDLKEKDTRIAQLTQQISGKDATIDRLTASDQQQNQLIADLREDKEELQEQASSAQATLVERTGEMQELRTSLELMNENVRLVQEKLADSREKVKDLEAKLEAAPGTGGGTTEVAARPPSTPIQGLVTSVDELAGGQTLVAINVGSNDEVQPGMNFIIHRDGRYVATMEVIKVDQRRAAGRVTLKEGVIEPNLRVTTPMRGF